MSSRSVMSKSRLHEIESRFAAILKAKDIDTSLNDDLVQVICDVMKYDPFKSTYSPEQGKYIKEYRRKMKEEHGISTYVTSGLKKFREKHKPSA